jgi:hypothetical protein
MIRPARRGAVNNPPVVLVVVTVELCNGLHLSPSKAISLPTPNLTGIVYSEVGAALGTSFLPPLQLTVPLLWFLVSGRWSLVVGR